MNALVDDVGSFPLPASVSRADYDRAYVLAREAMRAGKGFGADDPFVRKNFYDVVVGSFGLKLGAGLDVVCFPQHYDMHLQVLDVVRKAMGEGSYVVDVADAFLPEVRVVEAEGQRFCEESGVDGPIRLRVCVTGPFDLYLREVGTVGHEDVLMMFAESIRRFAAGSVLDGKYVRTDVVSVDEPSLGFQDVAVDRDMFLRVVEKAFDFRGVTRQVHLHSTSRIADLLRCGNVDVLSFEFAGSPRNIENVSKRMLDEADKRIRVGVARTDIDSILAEFYGKGVAKPSAEQLVDYEDVIRKRFVQAEERFGRRLGFVGPDCGLGGWPSQDAALLLLRRTVSAVKSAQML
jgi:5-methyltetrahydropteroyltriglutamate--homocysteine methyltransferase